MFQYLRFFFSSIIIFCLASCTETSPEESATSTSKTKYVLDSSKFIGENQCKTCHNEEYQAWKGSHHELAMQIADSSTVLGNFNDQHFSSNNIKYHFFTRNDEFYVNTRGEDNAYHDYKITYTFGVEPLQQYLVEFPKGQYQCLQAAWDTKKNTWFDLQPSLKIKHDEWINWTGGAMRWNTMCADCHSTDLKKNYNPTTGQYKTTFNAINVNCEGCHGPGSLHADFYTSGNGLAEVKMNTQLNSKELVDACARCHSRRSQLTTHYDYQGTFTDHYNPSLLVNGLYHDDGQIKDEVYVYGSFVQSKMYHNDVACNDCHDVHSLKLKATGNTLCLQCHDTKYNKESHLLHPKSSEGAQCINCHMPGKHYMGNDFRRDHSFRVPRPDLSLTYDTPNACENCHSDKGNEWATKVIQDHFGPTRAKHFSDLLLEGKHKTPEAYLELAHNGSYPDIARATALHYANIHIDNNELDDLIIFLSDSSNLVRKQAITLFENRDGGKYAKKITPLLSDTSRLVRITAANYFHELGTSFQTPSSLHKANKERETSKTMQSDFQSGLFNIALDYEKEGNIKKAQSTYLKVIEMDNYFNPARMNLALLEYKQGNIQIAETLYLKVVSQEPEFAEAYYMLGLLYNEKGDSPLAKTYLQKACDKQNTTPKMFYNYAILLQQEKKYEQAHSILQKGDALFPDNPDLLYLKLLGYANTGKIKDALTVANHLCKLDPYNNNFQQIRQQLTLQQR